MSSVLKTFLSCGVAALLSCIIAPAQAGVLLTFDVNNVTLNACAGAVQPTCTVSAAAGFQQTVVIGGMPLALPTDSSFGSVLQSEAFFGFPVSMSGSPYTGPLRARVSGPVTFEQSFTQLNNSYDQAGGAGTASALISSDVVSDTIDALGVRTQQEYQLGYNLLGQFASLPSYTDLVNQSIDAFFSKYIGTMTGSFNEQGTSSALDPLSLAFTDYAFSEYMGDITLIGVQLVDPVPEPASPALLLAAALAMLCARRRRPLRSNAAPVR